MLPHAPTGMGMRAILDRHFLCVPGGTNKSQQALLVRAEEPETVFENFRCHPQLVGRLEGSVSPFEDVNESIPVNELLGCQSACCLFFSRVVTVCVPEVNVRLLVLDGATALDLQ